MSNRLQELGLALAFFLFFYGSVLAALNVKSRDLNWSLWFFGALMFLGYTFIIPAYVFYMNTGAPVLPSIFASREYIVIVIGPAIWFLYRAGLEIELIEKTFLITLGLLIVSYIFHYFRMDLAAALQSTDHAVRSLVSLDLWRGYRLRAPAAALFLVTVIAPVLMFTSQDTKAKLIWSTLLLMCIYIWSLLLTRAEAATLLAGVLCYHMFFARKVRLGLFFAVIPVIAAVSYAGTNAFLSHLESLGPYDRVRYVSYNIAWETFLQYPILGFGQDSRATLTYQQIYWKFFWPSDIGLAGISFKYGVIGVMVYIFFSIYMIKRLVDTSWEYRKHYKKVNIILIALLILFISYTLNIILSPKFMKIPDLTLGSISIALTSIWRHKMKSLAKSRE